MPTVTNRVQVLGEDPGTCGAVLARIDERFQGCDFREQMASADLHVVSFEVEVGEKLSEYFKFLSKQNEEVTIIHDYCGEIIGEHAGRRIWHKGEKTVPSQCDEAGYFREGTVLAYLHWLWLHLLNRVEYWFVQYDDQMKAHYICDSDFGDIDYDPDTMFPLDRLLKLYDRHLASFPLGDIPAFQLPQPK